MDIQECLTNIIGLSKIPCSCLGVRPDGSSTSLSGFYIDDRAEGIPLKFPAKNLNCEDSLWTVMADMRESAIREFAEVFPMGFMSNRKPSIIEFFGTIGEGEEKNKITQLLTPSDSVIGMILKPKSKMRGARMTVRDIGLYVNVTDDYTVNINKIAKSPGGAYVLGALIGSLVVEAVADTKTLAAFPSPLELPLNDSYGNQIMYAVTYDRGTSRPWNVMYSCNCGGVKPPWGAFIEAKGIEPASGTIDNMHSNGLYLNIEVGCRTESWLCEAAKNLKSEFTIVMAKTIQLMAIRALLHYTIENDKVSYWTLLAEEKAPWKFKKLDKGINDRLLWLTENAPEWVSECFMCSDSTISKGSIRV